MLSPHVYTTRRRALQSSVRSGIIIFFGNDDCPINFADNVYPFRQDSSFLYYFGLDLPGLSAVIDIEEDRVTVYGEDPPPESVVWAGVQPELKKLALAAGVTCTAPRSDLQPVLERASQNGRPIHFLPPYRPQHLLWLGRMLDVPAEELPGRCSKPLIRAVVAQRSVKSAEEIEQIENALQITEEMHRAAMMLTRPGALEREVLAAIEAIARAAGSRVAYPAIFSVRGEILHNTALDNRMAAGQLAVHDSGAESQLHYAADITRTIPVEGVFNPRQRDIYQVVFEAQRAAIGSIRPKVAFREVHEAASRQIAAGLTRLGLMRGDPQEATAAGAHALFFPHGIGHMLGLDVHDMEALGEDHVGYTDRFRRDRRFGIRHLRLARELEVGFVVTVEPGIYFIPHLIDQWRAERRFDDFIVYDRLETYRDFGGIRIEDDVAVEPFGCRILGPPIPRSIEAVEALCGTQ